jgi:uncharacterized protein YhfF
VLLDGACKPCGIVQTTKVDIMPFGAVTDEMANAYGEGERTVEWWRRVIGAYYRASAEHHGAVFADETPLIWEWIEVVRWL